MKLVVNNLEKFYGNNKVVDDVSFEVHRGKIYGILGRNGAGKTTIIKMILDIISKDGGEVLIDSRKLNVIKDRVGYLPEEKSLFYKSTVKEQLLYFSMLSGLSKKESKKKIDLLIERFELTEFYNKAVETLSKGNQQKVQIISSIINDPNIIIFDEPFSGLDPVNSEILRDVVIELMNEGKYILFCTHQLGYIEEFCDSISIMKKGRQLLEGNLFNIKKGYGRKRLILEIEGRLPDLRFLGISNIKRNKNFYDIEISNENIANSVMNLLFIRKIKIINFSLKYKSLHEIFLEVVGEA